jgi:hypothetical protein
MSRKLLVALALFAAAASAFAAEAGRIVFVAGKAQLGTRPATLEASVQEGDEMSTGADGYIYMKTIDSGFLILRPNSKARVHAYHIDEKQPENTHVKLELLSGVARSISGEGVKKARQNFRFNTPAAAIGVRGTDFVVYTTQQASWVSVASGGVVVSAFSASCGPEGGGPCEGGNSRELFAGRPDLLLKVQRGQDVPQLLNNAVIAPEVNAPARSDEPSEKAGAGTAASAAATPAIQISLEPIKNLVASNPISQVVKPDTGGGRVPPISGGGVTPTSPPPVVVVVAPPAALPDPVVPPAEPEIVWGRWQSVANAAPDQAVIDKLSSSKYDKGIVLGAYALSRVANTALVMPLEGTAAFQMVGGEATLQKNDGTSVAADLKDGKLSVDFGARSFSTSVLVTGSLGDVKIQAAGDITDNGRLESTSLTGSTVRGYLGGAQAKEAAYLFKTTGEPALKAAGVVQWSR